ncbi:MAG: large-conductance mechanosensitive channel protein MscL [Deltaproteobacteria bacterium]|nr:large-conductance mechanosensitive channel protein MscL [Deltaproteobacteria bacterium]
MLKEFKEFALKGNMFDMAVGIILGASFGKIISSLVNDVLMPPIGMALGNVDFSKLFINLSDTAYATLAAAQESGAPTINYGAFINGVLDFVIVAFVLFLIIRQMNRMKREEEAPAAAPTMKECIYCLSSISIKATRCAHCTATL